jgi:hypothetical protein
MPVLLVMSLPAFHQSFHGDKRDALLLAPFG